MFLDQNPFWIFEARRWDEALWILEALVGREQHIGENENSLQDEELHNFVYRKIPLGTFQDDIFFPNILFGGIFIFIVPLEGICYVICLMIFVGVCVS